MQESERRPGKASLLKQSLPGHPWLLGDSKRIALFPLLSPSLLLVFLHLSSLGLLEGEGSVF
jgi:hypothetical protein